MSELIEVKTIGEVEHIVHGSGQWDGTGPVEFSNDGETWIDAWTPSDDHPHPQFARVAVYRKEVRIPTTVTIRWDEQFPAASEEWAGKWSRSPMRHFGRTVRMIAFRQTFRELLGDVVIEDEDRGGREVASTTAALPEVQRDWAGEIAAAESTEALDVIEKDARAARIFTPDGPGTALHRALKDRRRSLADAAWKPLPTTRELPAESPYEALVEKNRPATSDYLPPANRAARRAIARKKGGRR